MRLIGTQRDGALELRQQLAVHGHEQLDVEEDAEDLLLVHERLLAQRLDEDLDDDIEVVDVVALGGDQLLDHVATRRIETRSVSVTHDPPDLTKPSHERARMIE